jgi:hypothetical protein
MRIKKNKKKKKKKKVSKQESKLIIGESGIQNMVSSGTSVLRYANALVLAVYS